MDKDEEKEAWITFATTALQNVMYDYGEFPIQEQARVSALMADALLLEMKQRFK